ncbi:MAG: hypothetical protein HKL95_00440, partial [Phycisphaerae bacterium]|nr:hypothetical protein [Phycisphaerae bacterium]
IRVLFVGGDWKSMLPNYHYMKDGKPAVRPLRGFYVRERVEKLAPGKFHFTLWTSYEYLQYGDRQSLREFDVVVMEDVMGTSVVSRLVEGMRAFVADGGGVMFGDGYKAMTYDRLELSFNEIMPIDVVPFRPFGPTSSQPLVAGRIYPTIVAPADPVVKGIDFRHVPPMNHAHYGKVKAKATVLATMQDGKPLWVSMEYLKGRTLWTGGLFSNDEFSEEFAQSPQFGQLYVNALSWLAKNSRYPHPELAVKTAVGTLRVDFRRPGAEITARLFSVNGQESTVSMPVFPDDYASERLFTVRGGEMAGEALALFQALNPDGAFDRTAAAAPPEFVKLVRPGMAYQYVDHGNSVVSFKATDFDFKGLDATLADIFQHLHGVPILLGWCPWTTARGPSAKQYAHYFAAALAHVNAETPQPLAPAHAAATVRYFEPTIVEPEGRTVAWFNRLGQFFNTVASELKPHFSEVLFGMHGWSSYPYCFHPVNTCGDNLDWLSMQPYGHTGEAIFNLWETVLAHARQKRSGRLKMIVTEWDFWLYGHPAFDSIMQMWRSAVAHADTCLGVLHYRWTEFEQGGYVFGLIGRGSGPYGQLPPQWPRPGLNRPITYRYNAFWLMRHCRGVAYPTVLDVPALATSPSTRAYAIATCAGGKLNIVIYYGYSYHDVTRRAAYEQIRIHVRAVLPPQVRGRQLTIARADAVKTTETDGGHIDGDVLDMDITIPNMSGVSLGVGGA